MKYIKFDLFLKMNFLSDGLRETPVGLKGEIKKPEFPKLPEDQKTPVLDEWKAQRDELSSEKLSTITNKDFLKVWFERRLQYITAPKADFTKIASWEQKEITFTFTYNSIFNRDLYLNTTAGQVLPKEVNIVKIDWETYLRTWLKWEFFNAHGQRLIIREATKIEIPWVRDKAIIEKQEKENVGLVSNYISENPDANKEIVKEAIDRWIDPKFALLAFKDTYDKTSHTDKASELEDMMTEFDRTRDYINGDVVKDGKYNIEIAATLMRQYNKDNWKQLCVEYWYASSEVDTVWNRIADYEQRASRIRGIDLSDKKDFIEKSKAIAKKIEENYGIPWEVIVGQAALESGWWKSGLSERFNNFFWIKAFRGEQSVSMDTREVYNGISVSEKASFVVFQNMEDSFIGHAEFLIRNPRYRDAFRYAQDISPRPWYYPKDYVGYDPIKFLQEVKNAGYATDPNYVASVSSLFSRFA